MFITPLESRLLFSSATLENGLLLVEGSSGQDRIFVQVDLLGTGPSVTVTINGEDQAFPNPLPPLDRVVIRGAAGNDSITLRTLFGELPTTVDGGAGNDRLSILARGTTTMGGRGNDRITIDSNGDDPNGIALGGSGNDLIVGGPLDNNLHGGKGNDTLIGNEGDDQLFGDDGNDVLKGNAGIDTFFGGDGNDRLYPFDDNVESVDGGDGRDRVYNLDCGSSAARDVLISIEKGNCP